MTELLLSPGKSLWWHFRQQLNWRDAFGVLCLSIAFIYNHAADGPPFASLALLLTIALMLSVNLAVAISARRYDCYVRSAKHRQSDKLDQ